MVSCVACFSLYKEDDKDEDEVCKVKMPIVRLIGRTSTDSGLDLVYKRGSLFVSEVRSKQWQALVG